MKILHIIRSLDDARPLETARSQMGKHRVTVLLLHDAVLRSVNLGEGVEVLAGADDAEARGGRTTYPRLDYDGIVRAIFEHDRVISW